VRAAVVNAVDRLELRETISLARAALDDLDAALWQLTSSNGRSLRRGDSTMVRIARTCRCGCTRGVSNRVEQLFFEVACRRKVERRMAARERRVTRPRPAFDRFAPQPQERRQARHVEPRSKA